jgi:uncharacterized protein with PIN domain
MCTKCKKIYWQGTHADHMRKKIIDLLGVSEKVLKNQEVVSRRKKW